MRTYAQKSHVLGLANAMLEIDTLSIEDLTTLAKEFHDILDLHLEIIVRCAVPASDQVRLNWGRANNVKHCLRLVIEAARSRFNVDLNPLCQQPANVKYLEEIHARHQAEMEQIKYRHETMLREIALQRELDERRHQMRMREIEADNLGTIKAVEARKVS